MIIAKLISGLGNQLFQYAIARHIALKQKSHLKLDVSFFKNQNLRSFKLHHYNIVAETANEKEIAQLLDIYSSTALPAKIYRRLERHLPKRYHRKFNEAQWWTYEPELLKVSSQVYLDGYWQHYKYFENLDTRIISELTLVEPYSSGTAELLTQINSNRSSVSIHIRRGDYITDPEANNFMGVMPLTYYQKAVKYIVNRVSNPVFYVFSDDLEWVKENLEIAAPTFFVDIDEGKKDYVELDVMSKCAHNIIANSSFSWWGAFLNQNPDKIVIAPEKWVMPVEVNNRIKIQFPSWVKM